LKGPHRSPNGVGRTARVSASIAPRTVVRIGLSNRLGSSVGVKAATVQTVGVVGVFLGNHAEIATITLISVGKGGSAAAAGSAVGLGAESILVRKVIGGYNLSS